MLSVPVVNVVVTHQQLNVCILLFWSQNLSSFLPIHHQELLLRKCYHIHLIYFTVSNELFLDECENFPHGSLKVWMDLHKVKLFSVLSVMFVSLF